MEAKLICINMNCIKRHGCHHYRLATSSESAIEAMLVKGEYGCKHRLGLDYDAPNYLTIGNADDRAFLLLGLNNDHWDVEKESWDQFKEKREIQLDKYRDWSR